MFLEEVGSDLLVSFGSTTKGTPSGGKDPSDGRKVGWQEGRVLFLSEVTVFQTLDSCQSGRSIISSFWSISTII